MENETTEQEVDHANEADETRSKGSSLHSAKVEDEKEEEEDNVRQDSNN